MDYPALRKVVEEQGLLNKTPWYYTRTTIFLIACFISALIVYYLIANTYLQIGIALFLGFIGVQFGLLGHDANHQAISKKPFINTLLGTLSMTLVNGVALSYWSHIHTTHHKNPNLDPGDPDIDYIISHSIEQAKKRKSFLKFITQHQAILFVPIRSLTVFSMVVNSVIHFFKKSSAKQLATEMPCLLLHFILWIGLPTYFIGITKTLLFYTAATILRGLYFSMIVVPNHTGMPTRAPNTHPPYLQKQIATARNITPSPVKDYLFGGLNYQIEHHLFPTMSRKYLRKTKEIVKRYCQDHHLPYKETGFFTCYKEVFTHLYRVGKTV